MKNALTALLLSTLIGGFMFSAVKILQHYPEPVENKTVFLNMGNIKKISPLKEPMMFDNYKGVRKTVPFK